MRTANGSQPHQPHYLLLSSLLCLALAAQGCTRTPRVDPAFPPELPEAIVKGEIPSVLPASTRIIPDTYPVELFNIEFSREAREKFDEERTQRIRSKIREPSIGDLTRDMAIYAPDCILIFPLCAGLAAAMDNALQHNRLARSEPTLISERESERLAALLRERANPNVLVQRTLKLTESSDRSTEERVGFPLLAIRFAEARLSGGTSKFLTLLVQAQAFLGQDAIWRPTTHCYTFPYPSRLWDVEAENAIDEAVSVVSQSIALQYFPNHPTSIERALWLRARRQHTVPAYNEYLQRYPDGAHSASARAHLKRLEQWNFRTIGAAQVSECDSMLYLRELRGQSFTM